MRTISDCSVGDTGVVAIVTGEDDISVRLLEMGLTPGVTFSVVGSAPFGDPLELLVRGYRLSLRRSEAKRVVIESQPVSK